MTKNIFLLRHAKSSWKDTSLNDLDRPLNIRGRCNAPKMAYRFFERGIEVDLIISSNARRSTDTAIIFADILGYKSKIVFNAKLYEATSKQILEVINQIQEKYKSILIVCHNPGITNVANFLSNVFIEKVPTTGIVGFSINGNWKNIKEKKCSFLFFDYPKNYPK